MQRNQLFPAIKGAGPKSDIKSTAKTLLEKRNPYLTVVDNIPRPPTPIKKTMSQQQLKPLPRKFLKVKSQSDNSLAPATETSEIKITISF